MSNTPRSSRSRQRAWPATALAVAITSSSIVLLQPGLAAADDEERSRRALPVYYVGTYLGGETDPGEPIDKLYREFHSVRIGDHPARWVRRSLLDMLDVPADDPDYTGIWPGQADVLGARVKEARERVVVDMTGIDGPGDPALEDEAALALQQLVYTATAAASLGGDTIKQVIVKSNGERITELWGAEADQPLTRDPFARSPIWIHAPAQGERIHGDLTVTGTAAFYENQGSWSLLDRDGVEIDAGSVVGDVGGFYRPYTIELGTLSPGRYTIKVFDPGGLGLPDRGPVDTKAFRAV